MYRVDKKWRFSVDNLMIGIQLADVSTRCSGASIPLGNSHPCVICAWILFRETRIIMCVTLVEAMCT